MMLWKPIIVSDEMRGEEGMKGGLIVQLVRNDGQTFLYYSHQSVLGTYCIMSAHSISNWLCIWPESLLMLKYISMVNLDKDDLFKVLLIYYHYPT